jgi:hypothetical protein
MKLLFIFTILILSGAMTVIAQSRSGKSRVEQIARKISAVKDLGNLDRLSLINGGFKVVIEHSIIEDRQFEVKKFRSFKAAELWLADRQRGNFPMKVSPPLAGCGRGRCVFDLKGGILHNRLYMKKVLYGYRNKRLYIKALYFLDGD